MPTAAQVSARVNYPIMRVPFMATPPTLDGRMDPGEWEDSSSFTACWQDYSHDTFLHLATFEKQPTFWFAYDNQYFYVAHRSPVFPRGAWLKAAGKYRNVVNHPEYGILNDDHVEFQLAPAAGDPNQGFFKWLFNPIDTPVDHFQPQQPGRGWDPRWDSRFELRSTWDEEMWVSEMRIPIETMAYEMFADTLNLPIPDGTIWRYWGSRAIGGTGNAARFFSAVTPGGWRSMRKRLILDSRGVSAQVQTLGHIMKDEADVQIQLKNHGERSEMVRVGFYIENDRELALANEEEEFVELVPGETRAIRLRRDRIGVTPRGNALWLDIRTLSGKMVYRSLLTTFHHVEGVPGFKEVFQDGMAYYRPARQPFGYTFTYYASRNMMRARIDTDLHGVEEAVKTAVEARVKLVGEDGQTIAEIVVPLEPPIAHEDARTWSGRLGSGTASFAKLPPGRYHSVCLLYDADRRIVGEQQSQPFEQRDYPWENSQDGLEDILPEPYVPIAFVAEENRLDTLKHSFTLEPSGLPGQIAIKGVRRQNPNWGPQLRGPLRFEASAGGRRYGFEADKALAPALERQSERAFESSGRIGPVAAKTRVQYDFDGLLTCDLHYRSDEPIDTLEFVFELAGPADLFLHYGDGEYNAGPLMAAEVLQRDPGIVWNSLEHGMPRELYYGNFTPSAMLGNGDRAFAWLCETDRGMKLLAEKAAMQLEKTDDGFYTLRVFLVNEPGTIEAEKHVRFALMTMPSKPQAANRRHLQWHYEGIGATSPKMSDGASAYSIHMAHDEDFELFKPKPVTTRLYTTANVVSWDMPSLRNMTYTGEFLGSSMGRPNPETPIHATTHPVTGRPNNTIFLHASTGWNWGQSMVDCAVHWRARQIRLGRLQGHWWDHNFLNALSLDPVIGLAYELPEPKHHPAGRLQYGFHYFYPRQFFTRLARIHQQAELPNTNAHYTGLDSVLSLPFLRDGVMWEGAGSYAAGQPHMGYYGLDMIRYYAMPYTGLNVYKIHDVNYGVGSVRAGADPILDRAMLASALLHDYGIDRGRHANTYPYDRVHAALKAFGFFDDEEIEFIPYWRSRHLYQYGLGLETPATDGDAFVDEFLTEDDQAETTAAAAIVCSFYRNPKTGKALVVLANPLGSSVQENLVLREALLGQPLKAAHDVEVDQPIPLMRDPKGTGDVANTLTPIFVDRYQFRLLEVE